MVAMRMLLSACLLITEAGGSQQDPNPKFIQTKYGDIFDCVDIYKQPSFSHPLLKGQKVQMWPSWFDPSSLSEEERQEIQSVRIGAADSDGQECPQGTVPIHRRSAALKNATALPLRLPGSNATNPTEVGGNKRFYAIRRTSFVVMYGVSGHITVWDTPAGANQVSTNYITAAKTMVNKHEDQIWASAGWASHPSYFGDSKSRLLIFWSLNGQVNICINTDCPGFVQVSSTTKLGTVLSPVSTIKGGLFATVVFIFKDHKTTDWWLSIDHIDNFVGYWDHNFFPVGSGGFDNTDYLQFGGFVICPQGSVCPPLGSGVNPNVDESSSSFINNIQFQSDQVAWFDVEPRLQKPFTNDTKCYSVTDYTFQDPDARYGFFYGGSEASCLS